jgi:hypothetical protein
MTTFIPSLTLPPAVFAHPAASILLPIGLGTAVGFSVQRTYRSFSCYFPRTSVSARLTLGQLQSLKRPTWHSSNPRTVLRLKYLVLPGLFYTD